MKKIRRPASSRTVDKCHSFVEKNLKEELTFKKKPKKRERIAQKLMQGFTVKQNKKKRTQKISQKLMHFYTCCS